MRDWVSTTLGEIAYIDIGGTPSRDVRAFWAEDADAGFQWASIADLDRKFLSSTKEQITKLGAASSNVKLVAAGTLVMSFKLSIGRASITEIDLYTNEAIAAIKPKNGAIDTAFLYHVLPDAAKGSVSETAIKGSTLNKKSLAKICLSLPRLVDQQKAIALILDTVDQAIETTEALIGKYQQVKAGLMHDLFTRGIGKDGKLRPPRSEAPDLYKETPIGWLPKEWDVERISEVVRSAEYGISTSLTDNEAGVPVLRMNNIQVGQFDVTDLKYSNDPEAYRLSLRLGDVLYNRTNSMEHVGKTAIWCAELPECSFASYLVRMNLVAERMMAEFFSYWMNQPSSQNSLRRFATPAVQQVNINPTNVQRVIIGFPDNLEEQREIVRRIQSVDRRIEREQVGLEKIRKQKTGLMHDLLTGKVEVKVDEPEAEHV